MIFRSHCLRGFGLPASGFLRAFLEFYNLQPHHLMPNAVMLLSAFVTLCEGFLGVLPRSSSGRNSSKASSAPSSQACPPFAEPLLP